MRRGKGKTGLLLLTAVLLVAVIAVGCDTSTGSTSPTDTTTDPNPDPTATDLAGVWLAHLFDPEDSSEGQKGLMITFEGTSYRAMFFGNTVLMLDEQCSKGSYTTSGGNLILSQTHYWHDDPYPDWIAGTDTHRKAFSLVNDTTMRIPSPAGDGTTIDLIRTAFTRPEALWNNWNEIEGSISFVLNLDGTFSSPSSGGFGASGVPAERSGTWRATGEVIQLLITYDTLDGPGQVEYELLLPYQLESGGNLQLWGIWGGSGEPDWLEFSTPPADEE